MNEWLVPALGVAFSPLPVLVLVACSTLAVLLAGHALLTGRTQPALGRLRAVMARHDRAIAIGLGLVIGVFFVLDGLRAL